MREIPTEQVLNRLKQENPWWEGRGLPRQFADWKPRPYLQLLQPLVEDRQVRRAVALMGPRRVGKTVLLHHVIGRLLEAGTSPERICYFSVDHPIYNGLSLDQLLDYYTQATGTDLAAGESYVFFDEIQYLRGWEMHLKALVDRNPLIKLTVSGSAAAALRLKSSESGAGRFTDFLLPSLTFHEFLYLHGEAGLVRTDEQGRLHYDDPTLLNDRFVKYLNFGGYPEVAFSPQIQADPGRFIKSDIVDKVLLRDLPSLYGVQDIQELNYLFTTLAYNTGNEVSLEGLSKGSGVAKNTIKRYVEYLEAAFLIKTIHRVDRNAKRFKRANFFKVYLTNPSIRSALFSPIRTEDEEFGSLVETALFCQWFHSSTNLHYARWPGGEVDMIYLDPNQKVLWATEAKWSDRFLDRPADLKSLVSFCHANNLREAWITTQTASGVREHKSIRLHFFPASVYCYFIGRNIVESRRLSLVANAEPG